jgi:transketolase
MGGKRKVKKYIRALPHSDTKTEAKLTAGYDKDVSTYQIENTDTFKEYQRKLSEKIPDDKTIRVYEEALTAKKKDEADHYIRVKAAERVDELKGRGKKLIELPESGSITVSWLKK